MNCKKCRKKEAMLGYSICRDCFRKKIANKNGNNKKNENT